ncbi:MAG: MgtC/SapB family protein [Agriterribacter sp.]
MLTWNEILLRLAIASILGGIIGLERERKNWSAGMRTHMMVCLGSSLAMLVSAHGFYDVLYLEHVSLDPSRVAAQVISGIGFLGAGTIILLKQGIIKGLTTAAGLWTVAAIGLATGAGMYFAASVATVISLIILWVLQYIERKITQKSDPAELYITTDADADIGELIKELIGLTHAHQLHLHWERKGNDRIFTVELGNDKAAHRKAETLITAAQHSKLIRKISWGKAYRATKSNE